MLLRISATFFNEIRALIYHGKGSVKMPLSWNEIRTRSYTRIKERDLPQYVLVSDFERFRLFDLVGNEQNEFTLSELPQKISLFAFIAGYQTRSFVNTLKVIAAKLHFYAGAVVAIKVI